MSDLIDNTKILEDLDAGMFQQKIAAAMTDAGRAAIGYAKNSKVTIVLTYHPISNTRQCQVTHQISSDVPHEFGNTVDKDTKTTPVYIHDDGRQSITPQNQKDMFPTD